MLPGMTVGAQAGTAKEGGKEGGKAAGVVCANAPLHGGGAVLPPSRAQAQAQAQARLAQAQARATPRVKRQLDFAGIADSADREGEALPLAAAGPVEVLRAEPQLLSCAELGRLLDTLLKNKFV